MQRVNTFAYVSTLLLYKIFQYYNKNLKVRKKLTQRMRNTDLSSKNQCFKSSNM